MLVLFPFHFDGNQFKWLSCHKRQSQSNGWMSMMLTTYWTAISLNFTIAFVSNKCVLATARLSRKFANFRRIEKVATNYSAYLFTRGAWGNPIFLLFGKYIKIPRIVGFRSNSIESTRLAITTSNWQKNAAKTKIRNHISGIAANRFNEYANTRCVFYYVVNTSDVRSWIIPVWRHCDRVSTKTGDIFA